MDLTEDELLLIDGLKLCGVSTGMAAAIFMTARKNALEMCHYIADNLDATEAELLDKAREIAGAIE